MVKADKGHGLDRKFKHWRKGKSETAKSRKGTCKHQLRGQKRLLARTTDPKQKAAIETKIAELEAYIQQLDQKNKMKENANKSHGTRFLERQKLTRLYKSATRNEATTQEELYKIALDMVYVAHFPHEMKYLPLFKQGDRFRDSGRHLVRRAKARLAALQQSVSAARVQWIPTALYDSVPTEWSVDEEKKTFGAAQNVSSSKKSAVADRRFEEAALPQSILEAAAEIEKQVDQELPMTKKKPTTKDTKTTRSNSSPQKVAASDSSSDSSSSSSDDDEVATVDKTPGSFKSTSDTKEVSNASSSSSSTSSSGSSSSSSSSDSNDTTRVNPDAAVEPPKRKQDDWDDDFLVAREEDPKQVFSNAKQDTDADTKGDKSQGWATQNQRPGQYKKKRVRN